MSESVSVPMDDRHFVAYSPTGYMSRVSWVLWRKVPVRTPGPHTKADEVATPIRSGQGRNPEAAKKQAERAYHEALVQERTEAKVIEELRGFGNQ